MKVISKHMRRRDAMVAASKLMTVAPTRGRSSGWGKTSIRVERNGFWRRWRVVER